MSVPVWNVHQSWNISNVFNGKAGRIDVPLAALVQSIHTSLSKLWRHEVITTSEICSLTASRWFQLLSANLLRRLALPLPQRQHCKPKPLSCDIENIAFCLAYFEKHLILRITCGFCLKKIFFTPILVLFYYSFIALLCL